MPVYVYARNVPEKHFRMDRTISNRIFIALVAIYVVLAALSVFLPQDSFGMTMPAEQMPAALALVALANAGIVLVLYGGLGLIGLLPMASGHMASSLPSRMTRWRVDTRWYAVALATMPLLLLAILSALALLISPAFALSGLAALAAGFFEEIGWTGFAVPRLLSRWRPLAVGLGVGALWGLWHGLADYSIRGNARCCSFPRSRPPTMRSSMRCWLERCGSVSPL
jgi:membrane protease YdiL (CAAX protease family)